MTETKKIMHPRVGNLCECLGRLPKPHRIDRAVGHLLPKPYGFLYVVGMGRREGRNVVLTNTAEGRNHLLKAGDSLQDGLREVGGRADVVMVRNSHGRKVMEVPVRMALEKD